MEERTSDQPADDGDQLTWDKQLVSRLKFSCLCQVALFSSAFLIELVCCLVFFLRSSLVLLAAQLVELDWK